MLIGSYLAVAVAVLVSLNIAYGGLIANLHPPTGGHHHHGHHADELPPPVRDRT